MDVDCGEFARRGRTLLEGSGGEDDDVITLARSHGRYRAVSLLQGPIYYDPDWVARHFSPGAAAEIDSANSPMAPYPARHQHASSGWGEAPLGIVVWDSHIAQASSAVCPPRNCTAPYALLTAR